MKDASGGRSVAQTMCYSKRTARHGSALIAFEVPLDSKNEPNESDVIDNGHQKTVSGKNQRGPDDNVGKDAGGNAGSKGQNIRAVDKGSVGSHKPGGDGPGTKTFKHEHDAGHRRD